MSAGNIKIFFWLCEGIRDNEPFIIKFFQTHAPAGGNHEREGEQDHYFCGDQEKV